MKKLMLLALTLGIGLAATAGCSSPKDTTPVEVKGESPRGVGVKKKGP